MGSVQVVDVLFEEHQHSFEKINKIGTKNLTVVATLKYLVSFL